jgi:hypothetical protein
MHTTTEKKSESKKMKMVRKYGDLREYWYCYSSHHHVTTRCEHRAAVMAMAAQILPVSAETG